MKPRKPVVDASQTNPEAPETQNKGSFAGAVTMSATFGAALHGVAAGGASAWENFKAVREKKRSLKDAATSVAKATASGAADGAVRWGARGAFQEAARRIASGTDSDVVRDVLHGHAPCDLADAGLEMAKHTVAYAKGEQTEDELRASVSESARAGAERATASAKTSVAIGTVGRVLGSLFGGKKRAA